jgi:penicillin-binding protein 1A
MLRDVVTRGSATRALALQRRDLAGKTGTTNEGRDTWFVGFNANLIGAAWVGFDQFRPLGGYEQGGRTALPMWVDFMREALADTPERLPKRPLGIVEYRINPKTGLIAADGTFDSIFEKFDSEHLPDREEDTGFPGPPDALDPESRTRPAGEPIF